MFTLLGVPLDLGTKTLGVDIGPNAFRYEQMIEKLESAGMAIRDAGNIQCANRSILKIGNPKLKYLEEIIRVSESTAKTVSESINKGTQMIVLGGDHSISLGSISGASAALNGDLGLIYLDAHGDMNTDKTTATGNIHGMHLASLMGFGNPRLSSVCKQGTKIKKEHMIHIGGFDLDQGEIDLIRKEKLYCYKIVDILANGLAPLFSRIKKLAKKTKNIWVSIDLDAIDSVYAPGAGMPNMAGLTYREITAITSYISSVCHVIGVDVVEYNPLRDIDGKTADLSTELIAKCFGYNFSWYSQYMEKNKTV